MMGFVDKIPVKTGDKVSKGELLISINNAELSAKRAQVNASITEASAAYRNAEKDYNRFTALYNDNSASQKELDDMRAHFEMAQARLEAAQQMKNEVSAQFAYTNIRAPFSGIITGKFINEGSMASPGVPLIAIETPGKFEVTTRVAEGDIGQLKTGVQVRVVVKAIDTIMHATISEISTSSANSGGQFLVTAVLEKDHPTLRSGMYATVEFPVKGSGAVQQILIPSEAIISRGQLRGVYTVSEQNTAVLRWLRLGRSYGDSVEVLSGLSANESYIISSEGKLFNGVNVKIQ
jgi:RND family efflux transporter MFP subunit